MPKKWDATAPGRVEPVSQEIKLSPLATGRITAVLATANSTVFPGELLIRFDDEEALARLAQARAEAAMRQRARDDESKKGPADRRRAGDAVADAERLVADAQTKLDQAVEIAWNANRPAIDDSVVSAARAALSKAKDELRQRRDAFSSIAQTTGLPTFPESEVEIARANLTLARITLERTRLRAPIGGRVLQVNTRIGEIAASQQQPLFVLGDVSSLRVRAELDERDATKARAGQSVIVRAKAFKDRTFAGKVRSVAQFVAPSRLSAQALRGKLNDVDVVEAIIELTDPGSLIPGMQVDVYFLPDGLDRSSMK